MMRLRIGSRGLGLRAFGLGSLAFGLWASRLNHLPIELDISKRT